MARSDQPKRRRSARRGGRRERTEEGGGTREVELGGEKVVRRRRRELVETEDRGGSMEKHPRLKMENASGFLGKSLSISCD